MECHAIAQMNTYVYTTLYLYTTKTLTFVFHMDFAFIFFLELKQYFCSC